MSVIGLVTAAYALILAWELFGLRLSQASPPPPPLDDGKPVRGRRGTRRSVHRLFAIVLYVAASLAGALVWNANTADPSLVFGALMLVSLGIGWWLKSWAAVLLALLPALVAWPFGYTDQSGDPGHEEAGPIAMWQLIFGLAYAIALVAGLGVRRLSEGRRRHHLRGAGDASTGA
jgi:membrane protease YdiL (CAAX protease family)